jgi:hypothetical protein
MFQPDLYHTDDPALLTAKAGASTQLRAGVAAQSPTEDTALMSLAAWSIAHGFATLLLSHNLEGAVGEGEAEEVFRTLAGLTFRAQPSTSNDYAP